MSQAVEGRVRSEHAIRAHIREHLDQDPMAYRKLSERLRDVLAKLGEQWDALTKALQGLVDEIRSGHVAPDERLPDLPEHYGPCLRVMADTAAGDGAISDAERKLLVDLTVEVGDTISAELVPNFWRPNRQPARPWLESRVGDFAARMEVAPAGVRVQDLGYRWGSCGKGHLLYFHWRTILLPARIAEYVVVHEMAHLREPHHSPEFWRRVERALPDFERARSG